MDTPTGHDQNADRIACWNGPAGQRWAERQIWCRSAAPWINDIRDLPERPGD